MERIHRLASGICLVREMKEEDLAQTALIEAQLFSLPWSEDGFRASLQSADTLYLTAVFREEVVGYCGLLRSFDEAEITNVAVRENCQGLGIGRAMLRDLLEAGEARGISRFTLEVRKSNAPALHLYETLGFETVGYRKGFYERPREDAAIMWRG